MKIIRKVIKRELVFVAGLLFEKWYILYRLSRHAILQFGVILGKLNKSTTAYIYKLKKRIFQEYYSSSYDDDDDDDDDVELNNWSSSPKHILPREIMELILHRLPLDDYLRFGTVCRSWRFLVAKVIAEKRCTPALELPLLMFCAHPYTSMKNCFLSLNNDLSIFYKPNCPELHSRNCLGSIEGWLIMSDSIKWRPEGFINDFWSGKVKNFFLNPVSGARIKLPSQATVWLPYINKIDPLLFFKMVASAVPTSPNCIVVAVLNSLKENKLAFCRPDDSSWTIYQGPRGKAHKFLDVVFHDDGKLYAITFGAWHSITVFDLWESSQGCTSPSRVKVIEILPAPWPLEEGMTTMMEGHTIYFYDYPMFFLVKKDHDLLMIMHFIDAAIDDDTFLDSIDKKYTIPPRIKTIKVFKLDQSGPRWVHVPSLGDDQILFLCQKNYIIISATDAISINQKHQKNEEPQITGNCIYFAFDYMCTTSPQEGRNVGVFSLADGSIKRHHPSVPRSWLTLAPIWLMPNPW